jgi:hypothetical protein
MCRSPPGGVGGIVRLVRVKLESVYNLASTTVLVLLARSSTGSRVGNSVFAAAAAFKVFAAPDPDGRPEARRAEAVAVKRLARSDSLRGLTRPLAGWAGCAETVKRTTSSTAAAPGFG